MLFSQFRHMKLMHLLSLGFGLMLLCIGVTVGVNLVTNTQKQTSTNVLIDQLYPARRSAGVIIRLTLAIDNEGARYILSFDPHQQALLLQSYQKDVQSLHATLAKLNDSANTPQQRFALDDFTHYFFGRGGYYANNQYDFTLKRAGQQLTASDDYANSPFLPTLQYDMLAYSGVVEHKIVEEDAKLEMLTTLVLYLNIGVGGSAMLFGFAIAMFITRTIHRLYQQIEEKNMRLQALSTTDPLTELPNHRALLARLEQEMERAQRSSRSCSLLFLDLDHFKALNDSYGHRVGDSILRDFAGVLSTNTRSMDTVGRWGGEEFIAMLPEATTNEALEIAERIRTAVSFHSFGSNGGLHLTCSIGVACYPEHGTDQEALINAADQAMYGAKHLGRNQIRLVSDPAIIALLKRETAEGGREEIALRGTVEALVALVEARDGLFGHHSHQVSDLVYRLACTVGIAQEEARGIALAGLLHDIGKVAISDAILQKPGPLTEEEWGQIKRHSIVGAEVLNHIPSLRPLIPVIRAHHEHWDGQGYPDHLKADQIPLAARLIGVVDAYIAMITDRPYRPARSLADARAELRRCAGTQFDPQFVETLIDLLQEMQQEQEIERRQGLVQVST